MLSLNMHPTHSCQAAEEQQLEIQQHAAQLETALAQLKAGSGTEAPARAPVTPQVVEALLKQSRALRVRVQVYTYTVTH